jgi:hypothetical protein
MKKQFLIAFVIFGTLVVFSTLTAAEQERETITVQKSGRFHLGKAVIVGDKTLEAGMYQIQHSDENGRHTVIFRVVEMGYRGNMGNQTLGAEITRVECTVEGADKKILHTKVMIRKNAAGEREAFEVWIRGERVKHILPTRS